MDQIQTQESLGSSNSNDENVGLTVQSSNEVQTDFKELCDDPTIDFSVQISTSESSVDETIHEKAIEQSVDVIPPTPIGMLSVESSEILIVSEEGNEIQQVAEHQNEVHPQDNSIDQALMITESLSVIVDKTTRRKTKRQKDWPIHSIFIEKTIEKPIFDMSEIPKGSTMFTHDQNIIQVNAKQIHYSPPIGSGAFGSVHIFDVDELPNKRMAVKRIVLGGSNQNKSADTEFKILKKLRYETAPNIVKHFCALLDSDNEFLYICMEYMDTSIEKFYKVMHPFDDDKWNNINLFGYHLVQSVSTGLHYLTMKDIVHRDVKPANMLVNTNGEIKICDFGIAGDLTTRSESDGIQGTAAYMPPYSDPCAISSDMWSLGISLVEIFSGQHPFAGCHAEEIAFAALYWKPFVPPLISIELQALIFELLDQNADARPSSYADILNKFGTNNDHLLSNHNLRAFVQRVIRIINPQFDDS